MKFANTIFIIISILPLKQVSASSIYHVKFGKEIDDGTLCSDYYEVIKSHQDTDYDSIQRGIEQIGIKGNFIQVMKKELPQVLNRGPYLLFELKAVEPITIEYNNSNVISEDSITKSKNLAKKILKIKSNKLKRINLKPGKSFKGAITIKGYCGSNVTEKFQQKEEAIQKFVKIKNHRTI